MENNNKLEKKTNSQKGISSFTQWLCFVTFSLASVYLLYADDAKLIELNGIIWLLITGLAVICFPNKRFHAWLGVQWKGIASLISTLFWVGVFLVVAGIVIWIGWSILSGIGNRLSSIGKYEGQTAEEWFNDYDEAESSYSQLKDCIDNLPTGDFNNYDTYSLTSDIESCL